MILNKSLINNLKTNAFVGFLYNIEGHFQIKRCKFDVLYF